MLHDEGKIGVSDAVLLKPYPLYKIQEKSSELAALTADKQHPQRRQVRKSRILLRSSGVFLLLAVSVYSVWQTWMHTRTQPPSLRRELFQGVTYVRDVRRKPRPMVVHIVIVDLKAPGIRFITTPGNPAQKLPLRARLTSTFLKEVGAQLAINADFFYPWYSHNIFNYYPHIGDPVNVEGVGITNGVAYHRPGPETAPYPTLYFWRTGQARFGVPDDNVYGAISGNRMLLQNGALVRGNPRFAAKLDPRTAIGLNKGRNLLVVVLVDGQQPNYSEGATQDELGEILRQYGAWDGMNLDGGGSSTLAVDNAANGVPASHGAKRDAEQQAKNKSHRVEILNCPIDNHIPNRERPVANHLAVFARPL